MSCASTVRGITYRFSDLRTLFAKANEEKSGDALAGIAAASDSERVAAKRALADTLLATIVQNPLLDPEDDEVSDLICNAFDDKAFASLRTMTVGDFREYILDDATTGPVLASVRAGITPEMAAAVTKIMSNKDLIIAAAKIRNISRCRNTLGEAGVFGIRLQPNHPTDHPAGW